MFQLKQGVFNKFSRSSEHFRMPVKVKQAPNYTDVVKNGLDLFTLKKKIENGTVSLFLVF